MQWITEIRSEVGSFIRLKDTVSVYCQDVTR